MNYSNEITPKISIIVPVYNGEKYIKRCLESILNQTYRSYEVLVIDDGSKDESLKELYKYKKLDTRIKIFSQENLGPSSARNRGIKESLGKYLVFIDIDDYVNENYLEILCQEIHEEIDIVTVGYIDISKYGIYKLNDFFEKKESIITKEIMVKNIFKGVGGTLWGKLLKRKIIVENNLFLNEEIYMYEDQLFILEYILKCKTYKNIDSNLYNYNRLNENSLSSKFNLSYYESIKIYLIELKNILQNSVIAFELQEEIYTKKIEEIYFNLTMSIFLENKKSFIKKIKKLKFISGEIETNNITKLKNRILIKLKNRNFITVYVIFLKLSYERKIKDYIKFKLIIKEKKCNYLNIS